MRSTTVWNSLSVISLAINSSGDIFAGTFEGGGVYRSTDNGDNWTLIDNGLTNTYVTALAINSSNNIFAATFGGGAFRSTDNGDSWTALNTGVPNATFLSLAINASGYIFAGGDPLGGPVGVLRSTDNGDSWEPVNNGLDTGNGINALLATSNGSLFAGTYGDGVFRSTDNGDNWSQINNGLTTIFVLSFATNASGDIFAGTYFGGGVFRSTDNGDTWSEQNDGIIATEVRAIARRPFAIPIQHPNVSAIDLIFAGTYGSGMFRSSDSGGSWQKINNGLSALYESALAINANNHIFVGADFVGGAGGVYRSTDDGDNWVEINQGVITTDVRALGDQFQRPHFCGNLPWQRCVPLDRQWR